VLDLIGTIVLYVGDTLHMAVHPTNLQLSLEHIEVRVSVDVPGMLLDLIGPL